MTVAVESEQPAADTSSYFWITGEAIQWTVEIVPGLVFVDVDAEGRAIGIEVLNGPLDLPHAVSIIRAGNFAPKNSR